MKDDVQLKFCEKCRPFGAGHMMMDHAALRWSCRVETLRWVVLHLRCFRIGDIVSCRVGLKTYAIWISHLRGYGVSSALRRIGSRSRRVETLR